MIIAFNAFGVPFFDTDEPQPSAWAPLSAIDILEYRIFCDFTQPEITAYKAQVSITSLALTDLDSVVFDLCGNTVDSVLIGGESVLFERGAGLDMIIAFLPSPIDSASVFETVVYYGGSIPNQAIKSGFTSRGVLVIYSLFWPSLARFFFPCCDDPMDKAYSEVSIRVFEGNNVVSNGRRVSVEPAPDDSNCYIHTWSSDEPICTYNICFAFSESYVFLEDSVSCGEQMIPLLWCVPVNDTLSARRVFEAAKSALQYFTSVFGEYPFETFGQYVTPFTAGAMEHQSMVMLGSYVWTGDQRHLIGHELSHQWWGNAVGLGDFRDFFLNEGMAKYCEVLLAGFWDGDEAQRSYLANLQRTYKLATVSEGVFPVYDPDVYLSYTVYYKGACVFNMLRRQLGDSLFFGGMRAYYEHYRYGTVTHDSLFSFLEDYSGASLERFINDWVYGSGYPVINYSWWTSTDSLYVNFQQVQSGEPYEIFATIEIDYGDTSLFLPVHLEERFTHVSFPMDVIGIVSVSFDPYNDILCDKNYISSVAEDSQVFANERLIVFPNPFNHSALIELDGKNEDLLLSVRDIKGNLILRETVQGSTNLTMPQKAPSGIYIIELKAQKGDFRQIARVLYIQ
jgi:aminopeptidase N